MSKLSEKEIKELLDKQDIEHESMKQKRLEAMKRIAEKYKNQSSTDISDTKLKIYFDQMDGN